MELVWSSQRSATGATAVDAFEYLEEYKLIICKEHGYAVQNLKSHLQQYHVFHRDIRKTILQKFNALPLAQPHEATLPHAYGPPMDCLASPQRGFQCEEKDCRWISSSRAKIAEHANGHGWRSKPDEREHWTEVWVQSFFLAPGKQRWFIVKVEEESGGNTAPPIPEDVRAQKEMILKDLDEL